MNRLYANLFHSPLMGAEYFLWPEGLDNDVSGRTSRNNMIATVLRTEGTAMICQRRKMEEGSLALTEAFVQAGPTLRITCQ